MESQVTTIADLWQRPNVSMLEAIRMTGYTRRRLTSLIDDKKIRAFKEGQLHRIGTKSLMEYFEQRESGTS